MKKVLVSLLVLAVAVSGAFAAVNFSGNFRTGYVFAVDDNGNWNNQIFGQDNTNSNQTKLGLGIADENGYWTIGLEGEVYLDGSNLNAAANGNRIAGDITLDLAKMIGGADTDWSAALSLVANDRITALRAYTNKSGLNYDRVRTDEPGLWTNLVLGYGSLIQVQVGGAPALTGTVDKLGGKGDGDFIASVMTKPIDGLAVSVDWAYVGDQANVAADEDAGTPAYVNKDAYGVVGAAADVNVGALAGLDFDLGVGVADKYYYGAEKNVLAAQVYGGVDAFDAYAEYVLDGDISKLHLGANINAVENVLLNVYGGIADFSAIGDNFYVGANVGYDVVGGVTLQLNLQYAKGGYMVANGGDVSNGAVKAEGFSITPIISVNF